MKRSIVIEQQHPIEWYSAAEVHGSLTFLIPEGVRRPHIRQDTFMPHMMQALADLKFDPAKDSIVASGPLLIVIRLATCIVETYGPTSFLLFDGRLKAYRPVTCLLYTSPSPRDATLSRMPSSA